MRKAGSEYKGTTESFGRATGFTFLELAIVVMILGIIAMAAIPAMNAFMTEQNLVAAADEVVTAIYYARTTAITTKFAHRVLFNITADSFTVEMQIVGGDNPEYVTAENPLTKRDYEVYLGESWGVDLVSASFASNPYVLFSNLGTAIPTGTVELTRGDRTCTVSVTRPSCKVLWE